MDFEGDEASALLRECDWVHRLARALVADPGTAADAAQDTLLLALRRTPRAGAPIRPWLAGLLGNLLRQGRRSAGRRASREAQHAMERGAGEEDPALRLERLELHRHVLELVQALDEPYRATVVMRFLEDRAPNEIARRTGVPVTTVYTRLERALVQLRTQLDRRDGERGTAHLQGWAVTILPAAFTSPAVVPATAATGRGLTTIWIIMSTTQRSLLALALLFAAGLGMRAALTGEAREMPALTRTDTSDTLAATMEPDAAAGAEERSRVPIEQITGASSSPAVASRLTVIVRPSARPQGTFVVRFRQADVEATRHAVPHEPIEFGTLAAGPGMIEVEREGWIPAARTIEIPLGPAFVELDVDPIVRVVGQVVSSEDGAPLSAFVLALECQSQELAGVVRGSGRMEIDSPDGSYSVAEEWRRPTAVRVRIEAQGRLPITSDWVEANARIIAIPTLSLPLARAVTLRGRVLSESGESVIGAQVVFVPSPSEPVVSTGPDGLYVRVGEALPPLAAALLDEHGRLLSVAEATADGTFELSVPDGVGGALIAWAPGYLISRETWEAAPLDSGRGRTIHLDRSETLQIRVHISSQVAAIAQLEDVVVKQQRIRRRADRSDAEATESTWMCEWDPAHDAHVEVWARRIAKGVQGNGLASIRIATAIHRAGTDGPLEIAYGIPSDGTSVVAHFQLPDDVDLLRTMFGVADDSGKLVSQGFLDDQQRAHVTGIGPGAYLLDICGLALDQATVVVWSGSVAVEAGQHNDLGSVDLRALPRLFLRAPRAGVWRVERKDGGRISPLFDSLLIRSNDDHRMVIYGLPSGDYLVGPAQRSWTQEFSIDAGLYTEVAVGGEASQGR